MNSPFDLPVPDPLEPFGQEIYPPPWDTQLTMDQQILESIERSIEQPILPEHGIYADKICRSLDFIEEASIGNLQPAHTYPLLDGIFDSLITGNENHIIPSELSGFEPSPEPVPEVFGSFKGESPLPDDKEHFVREYHLPAKLSRGRQGSGCKRSKSVDISKGWCQLLDKFVSSVDCEECDENFGDPECEYWSEA